MSWLETVYWGAAVPCSVAAHDEGPAEWAGPEAGRGVRSSAGCS